MEVAELLKALAGDPLYVPVLLAAVFGLRRSEALGLRWSAIDFEARTFTIDTTVVRQHQDGKLVTTIREGTTKTESSARTLPLNDFAMKQLRHIKERQDHFRTICGDCYDTRYLDFVCVNKMGTLINPDYVSQTFAKQLKKNGLRHIRYHDLRHPNVKPKTKIFYPLFLNKLSCIQAHRSISCLPVSLINWKLLLNQSP